MRLLLLLALTLHEAMTHREPSCYRRTATLVPDEFGRLMARFKLRDPGGDVTINATIYTQAKLDRHQLDSGELDLVDKKRRSGNLIYNLHFPIHNPLPHIGVITFNHQVICRDPVPPFDKYLTTTSYLQDVVRYKNPSGWHVKCADNISTKYSSKTISKLGSWKPNPYFDRQGRVFTPGTPTIETPPPPTKIPARYKPKETCGQSIIPSQLVYGGLAVARGVWPWLAIVYLEPTNTVFCGSTVISMKHVITAAHCLRHPETNEPFKMEDMVVALGQFNRTNLMEKGVQRRKVQGIVAHRSFDPNNVYLHGDIAVLVLADKVLYTPYVRPICLWDSDTRLDQIQGQQAKVVGWGLVDNKQMTDTPYAAVVPIVSQEECSKSHPIFNEVDHDAIFCGGQRTGMGPCMGDSGSGLALQRTQADGRTLWYLRGIVSFNAPSNDTVCNLDVFSLFTDVSKYAEWITKIMRTT